jgi:hypothetical protein
VTIVTGSGGFTTHHTLQTLAAVMPAGHQIRRPVARRAYCVPARTAKLWRRRVSDKEHRDGPVPIAFEGPPQEDAAPDTPFYSAPQAARLLHPPPLLPATDSPKNSRKFLQKNPRKITGRIHRKSYIAYTQGERFNTPNPPEKIDESSRGCASEVSPTFDGATPQSRGGPGVMAREERVPSPEPGLSARPRPSLERHEK